MSTKTSFIRIWPLKSIGNPGKGLVSTAPDIARTTAFFDSFFAGPELKLQNIDCLDEMWEELVRLFHIAGLDSVPKFAAFGARVLREQFTQGLTATVCIPWMAFELILDKAKVSPKKFQDWRNIQQHC